jgi:mRNA-degrading endonuclease toxin of MazEF toxin-antitoxin module
VAVTGGDTNISLNIVPKGSGVLQSGGTQVALLTANTFTADQTLESTDEGAGGAPVLTLRRNSASPAASDQLARLLFRGEDSDSNNDVYGEITTVLLDPTSASEDGELRLGTVVAGALSNRLRIAAGIYTPAATGGDKGANTINASAVYDDGVLLANQVAASQAEMEAASSNTVFTSPGRQQYHPGMAKGWVQAGIAGDIIVSHNVTSVADTGTGRMTVTWATDFSGANYVAVATAEGTNVYAAVDNVVPPTAGTTEINSYNDAGSLTDPNIGYHVVAFGDQ